MLNKQRCSLLVGNRRILQPCVIFNLPFAPSYGSNCTCSVSKWIHHRWRWKGPVLKLECQVFQDSQVASNIYVSNDTIGLQFNTVIIYDKFSLLLNIGRGIFELVISSFFPPTEWREETERRLSICVDHWIAEGSSHQYQFSICCVLYNTYVRSGLGRWKNRKEVRVERRVIWRSEMLI